VRSEFITKRQEATELRSKCLPKLNPTNFLNLQKMSETEKKSDLLDVLTHQNEQFTKGLREELLNEDIHLAQIAEKDSQMVPSIHCTYLVYLLEQGNRNWKSALENMEKSFHVH